MARTVTLRTRSRAPYALVYVGPMGASIEGYGYTYEAVARRARKAGRLFVVAPIEGGRVVVTTEV